ncbi:hypothetical protein M0R45_016078 [Rubus argutus]|uniref:Uncharacterized protein n=1 Tax=Rubus argutus TaxID=59490 RepID=A0AAW1XS13_RUBAR
MSRRRKRQTNSSKLLIKPSLSLAVPKATAVNLFHHHRIPRPRGDSLPCAPPPSLSRSSSAASLSAPPICSAGVVSRAHPCVAAVSPLAQPDSFSALIHRRAQPRVASAFTALPPKLLPKATTPTSLHLHFHDRSN